MKPLQELIRLQTQVAIVTGGAKGIGKGICWRLAEAGAQVVIADCDDRATQETVSEISNAGGRAAAYIVDVADEQQIADMVANCTKQFGTVDILVNNAGIYPSAPLAHITSEDFERIMHVNVRSVFLTTKYVSEVMKQQGGGKIINITSIDALHPSSIGLAPYDASKHGVWGFTKNVALELAEYKIWVNAIAPGGIVTPGALAMSMGSGGDDTSGQVEKFLAKIPMHRMGDADEIGKVALFLASDMASYMTGSQIVVDGGALLS